MAESLSPVFDRMPKYAWIMKLLLEPERSIIFRVAWLDDTGVSRVNRGFRIQYSSALGPYVARKLPIEVEERGEGEGRL